MAFWQEGEFWVAVGFVILVGSVWKPVKRALLTGLDDRAAKIKVELDEARRLNEEAQALLADYRKKQSEALVEAEAIVRHAAEEAERNRRQAEADLAAALKRREQQALERIAQAEAKALDEVRATTVDLAIRVTRQLIADNLDQARAGAIVDQAISELPERLH
jgi:F-type H+-transporting ATPase subunit b